jgi:hypothetical protein
VNTGTARIRRIRLSVSPLSREDAKLRRRIPTWRRLVSEVRGPVQPQSMPAVQQGQRAARKSKDKRLEQIKPQPPCPETGNLLAPVRAAMDLHDDREQLSTPIHCIAHRIGDLPAGDAAFFLGSGTSSNAAITRC